MLTSKHCIPIYKEKLLKDLSSIPFFMRNFIIDRYYKWYNGKKKTWVTAGKNAANSSGTNIQSDPLESIDTNTVYFDDLRILPFNANMKSFVYNPINLRLMAELDENNYSTFYEYDDDGTLVRIKKETDRGIMTIKETRSALLKTVTKYFNDYAIQFQIILRHFIINIPHLSSAIANG